MDFMVNMQIHSMFSSLGSSAGDSYLVNPQCLGALCEIWKKLCQEDRTLRTFRRAIGVSQVIKKDFLPLLVNCKDDRDITDMTIKILANLTMPVECLLPMEVMSKTDPGRNTIYELNLFLSSCKEAFVDPRYMRCILDIIKRILDKKETKVCERDMEVLSDCVTLLRNILQLPELSTTNLKQNHIIWNAFSHNFDKMLLELITGEESCRWGVIVVQLIALLYRDQQATTLSKLLTQWFESAVSDSSEDNESNTSPPERDTGDSSSSMMTSDPTSDSSDNNGDSTRKLELESSSHKSLMKQASQSKKTTASGVKMRQNKSKKYQQEHMIFLGEKQLKMEGVSSETSDCGYGTQLENQESVSTSSNEEGSPTRPVHQKPSNMIQKTRYPTSKPQTPLEKHELKRKKLARRSKLNSVKALLHHSPSDDDITHLLKEFTVDFLLKGYSSLVSALHRRLIYDSKQTLDSSHFLWLITYFLKFVTQLELDFENISSVLSVDIVFYLTYEGVHLSEQFELSKQQSDFDLAPCIRKQHLVVTALREVLQTVNVYLKMHNLPENDKKAVIKLQRHICETEDLRCLFVLLLRQFTPTLHSRQYLQDLVVTNHELLTFIENTNLPNSSATIQKHMRQFMTVDMMSQYGLLLECFQDNGEFVNDCVLTMMHHVAGDLDCVSSLFQPPILKTFTLIWESDFQICDDWTDLIEYVIHKLVNTPRSVSLMKEVKTEEIVKSSQQSSGWTEEESHNLYWYYVQSASSRDPVGSVLDLYYENGVTNKTRIGVIEKLLEQDIITRIQYQELMEKEPISTVEDKRRIVKDVDEQLFDEIEILTEHLLQNDKMEFVTWVQKALLEACHAKLFVQNKTYRFVEPVPLYCTLLGEPIPLVTWNSTQCMVMQYQPFVLLLHKLGLLLPADVGKLFARIPEFWTADNLLTMAKKLGPLNKNFDSAEEWVKFEEEEQEEVERHDENCCTTPSSGAFLLSSSHRLIPYISFTPDPNSMSSKWLSGAKNPRQLKQCNLLTDYRS